MFEHQWGWVAWWEDNFYVAYLHFWRSRNQANAADAAFLRACDHYENAIEPFELAGCAYENAYYEWAMQY